MFVSSFPDPNGRVRPSPLIRIAVIAIGPLVWNAAVLLVLFLLSVFLGPMLSSLCVKFGSVMASIAHVAAVIGLIGFFEFLVCPLLTIWYICLLLGHTVVFRTMGRFSCCPRPDSYYCHPTCTQQSLHIRVLIT